MEFNKVWFENKVKVGFKMQKEVDGYKGQKKHTLSTKQNILDS